MIFNFNAAEIFDVAIKIEENGKKFYDTAKGMVDDPEVKALFADLGEQEIGHKERFQSLKKQLPPEASSPTVFDAENELNAYLKMMADQHVFVSSESVDKQLAGVKDVKSALKLAIEFEKDSVIFFLTVQDATEGSKGKAFIGELVKEEQEHLRRLTMQLRKLG
ncbi:ferritin-like domain-containing protein [Desulforhabdus amnigena]|jgi:rubrerythrin|uniref:Rubrerythrin n=1 Tax=Desulforhabdus amnigena TaxID=40218 RepID=A0A9W6FWS1_9BACT|nr:ferritin family protein [Desulforhabdus amnigena]NLJ29871.1 ferritin family protein [Deltaproteobacteria bacterium]GLI36258.1 rubrerythrin [Desulforhabdus amnigena]